MLIFVCYLKVFNTYSLSGVLCKVSISIYKQLSLITIASIDTYAS